jgi:hypothetical protein
MRVGFIYHCVHLSRDALHADALRMPTREEGGGEVI